MDFRDDLEGWLKKQPIWVSVAIAARAGLRTLPNLYLASSVEHFESKILLSIFRSLSTALLVKTELWTANDLTFEKLSKNVYEAVRIARSADGLRSAEKLINSKEATRAMDAASCAADVVRTFSASSEKSAAGFAARAAAPFKLFSEVDEAATAAILRDCEYLSKYSGEALNLCFSQPLWGVENIPSEISNRWRKLKEHLSVNQNWQVWTNWYEDRLNGPGATGRLFIFELERDRILLPESDWNHSENPAHINGYIAALEARYRSNVTDAISLKDDGGSSGFKSNFSEALYQKIEDQIATSSDDLKNTLDGLVKLVEAEKIREAEQPPFNDPDSIVAQQGKIDFLEKLLSGLLQIRASLSDDRPKKTVERIDQTLKDLERWYLRQPNYVQKSVRLTGVMSASLGSIALGAPSLMALPFVACFFAKEEIGEAAKIVKNVWSD